PELDLVRRRPAIYRIDLASLPGTIWEKALEEASGQVQRGFDLGRAPLLASAWFDVPGSSRVLLTAHHLVVDAVSWRILIEEMELACLHLLRGEPVDLPVELIGFADWSRRLADFAQSGACVDEVDHWLSTLRGYAARLPVDLPAGRNIEGTARSIRV